eukprot:4761115-Prymnesium_polylepis.1
MAPRLDTPYIVGVRFFLAWQARGVHLAQAGPAARLVLQHGALAALHLAPGRPRGGDARALGGTHDVAAAAHFRRELVARSHTK